MDPSQTLNPTLTPESFQMSYEESSPRDSAASHPETLIRELRNLTLNASARMPAARSEGLPPTPDRSQRTLEEARGGFFPYPRRGVRTLLWARRERLARLRFLIQNRFALLQNQQLRDAGVKGVQSESRSVPFKCTCSYCVYHGWDPSENARIGNDYDTESG